MKSIPSGREPSEAAGWRWLLEPKTLLVLYLIVLAFRQGPLIAVTFIPFGIAAILCNFLVLLLFGPIISVGFSLMIVYVMVAMLFR